VRADAQLAQSLHEGVAQRLAGVAAALGAAREVTPEVRERCAEELSAAIGELRGVMEEAAARGPGPESELESLIRAFVVEGIRNAQKHADPHVIAFSGQLADDRIHVEVVNDGVSGSLEAEGTHLGLELIGLEATRHGGSVTSEPVEPGRWRTALTLPR
jgi:signal transduction histidine kinase